MKWLLLFYLVADGPAVGSAEFNSLEACNNARKSWEATSASYRWRSYGAVCVQKGAE